ncbi:dTDP-4-dehydrorhamnose reductase [Flavobacterium sp.]|uniref:dTDP-4-dehydrorhamnose reductase n=1 Tax=Flavobacterium sp. TaxID=239 RepID=UPI0011FF9A80|nr:dTDP-4-dehydrorhamnose reductase [Flavobacterium sp.]RZJ71960.1 MAG: dTDP-4-dehydrorhamnose reductase [Flavobacterium sp.]
MVILVTGASGQLGQALKSIHQNYENLDFHFADSSQADITNLASLEAIFDQVKPEFCINAAAYTAVDKAESEPEKAQLVNVAAAANLAAVCLAKNCTLVHVSTDFVFDGNADKPYSEEQKTNPQGVYGRTKRDGELEIQNILTRYFIIRTSWVYSEFGHNFMKTMLRLAKERDEVNVVDDQVGTPTYAVDLARAIIAVITSNKPFYGIYNFSNEGICSWHDFASEIFSQSKLDIKLNPIPTSAFPTPAKRPAYSVLDKSKIKSVFSLEIRDWKIALSEALAKNNA